MRVTHDISLANVVQWSITLIGYILLATIFIVRMDAQYKALDKDVEEMSKAIHTISNRLDRHIDKMDQRQ